MQTFPSITVIIPAHNEEIFISQCIASIKSTDWPKDKLEIIVVDNRSSDRTAELASLAGAHVVQHNVGTIGAIRNAGLKAACGEIVAYVDGDCTVGRSWLHCAVELLQSDPDVGAVGGPCLSPESGTWIERSLASSTLDWNGVRQVESLATSSFIATRQLLNQLGMFDEYLLSGEDDDISRKILQRRRLLLSASGCHVVHHGYPRSWWALLKKQMWHGSNQLETSSRFDPTLLITHIFLISSISLLSFLLAKLAQAKSPLELKFAILILLWCMGPLIYAAKRLKGSPKKLAPVACWFLIGVAYFLGRSLGLLRNYWRRLTN